MCVRHITHTLPCTGLTYVGCYQPPDGLKSYEGSTRSLSDDPQTREEPVRKCAAHALQEGYTLFALAGGSCYGGVSTSEDFTAAGESNLCSQLSDHQVEVSPVDVYSITDSQGFQETAQMADSCGGDFCTARELVCSSSNRTLASVMLSLCLVLSAFASLIFV